MSRDQFRISKTWFEPFVQDSALIYRLSEGGANEKVNLRVWECYFNVIELSSF